MTQARTPDRRQRKSRAALQRALIALVAAKPYDAITIEDITATADVARATFYAHFKDKPDLLLAAGRDLVQELADRVRDRAAMRATAFTGAGVLAALEHAEEHRDLYLLVLGGGGGSAVRAEVVGAFESTCAQVLTRMAAAAGRSPRVSLPLASTALAGALMLTIETWLATEPRVTPEALTTDFVRAQAGGLEWALGFEPGETRLELSRDL